MNSEGKYTHSTVLDYPSISQVNLKVKQNAINVIFAVTAQQIGVYEKLAKHVEGSSSAVLSEDSSNVVDLVKDQYGVSSTLIRVNFLLKCVVNVISLTENLIVSRNERQCHECSENYLSFSVLGWRCPDSYE